MCGQALTIEKNQVRAEYEAEDYNTGAIQEERTHDRLAINADETESENEPIEDSENVNNEI